VSMKRGTEVLDGGGHRSCNTGCVDPLSRQAAWPWNGTVCCAQKARRCGNKQALRIGCYYSLAEVAYIVW
jgi:hypothetical protein